MRKVLIAIVILSSLILLCPSSAYAAGAVMQLDPHSGDYGTEFTTQLRVVGQGVSFNAAAATVVVSPTLRIKEVIYGDCNFSFLKTPTTNNPSFSGVILSGSEDSCSVYTLRLVPIKKGSAAITVTDASVKQFGDAAEILQSVKNAEFTLTGEVVFDVQPAASADADTYTTVVNVIHDAQTPASDVKVTLVAVTNAGTVSQQSATTNQLGQVTFNNLSAGLYQIQVWNQEQELAQVLVTIGGDTSQFMFTIDLSQQTTNPLLKPSTDPTDIEPQTKWSWWRYAVVAAVAGMLATAATTVLMFHFKRTR